MLVARAGRRTGWVRDVTGRGWEIDRLRGVGLSFRSDVVSGPGGRQILLADPAGNLIEGSWSHGRRPTIAGSTNCTACASPKCNVAA